MFAKTLLVALLLSTPAIAPASPLPEYPFVFTTGSAERHVAPDGAHLRFEVRSRQPDVDKAISVVESASQVVARLLDSAGVEAEDIDASVIDKSPTERWNSGTRTSLPDSYDASRSFSVTIRDLSKYPQLVKGIFDQPDTENFSVGFDRSDHETVAGELLEVAAKDAHARATRMAVSFGRSLGHVRGIAQVPFTSIDEGLGFPSGRAFAPPFIPPVDPSPSLDRLLVPATIRISVNVNAIFELR